MLKPYLVDLGYSIKEIGFMSRIVGTSVAALSSLLAAFLISLPGRRYTLIGFSFLSIISTFYHRVISFKTQNTLDSRLFLIEALLSVITFAALFFLYRKKSLS